MTHQEANKLKLVNRLENIAEETQADMLANFIQKYTKLYKDGFITAEEFINKVKEV